MRTMSLRCQARRARLVAKPRELLQHVGAPAIQHHKMIRQQRIDLINRHAFSVSRATEIQRRLSDDLDQQAVELCWHALLWSEAFDQCHVFDLVPVLTLLDNVRDAVGLRRSCPSWPCLTLNVQAPGS